MKIKTILRRLDGPNMPEDFDTEVNKALEEGWTLTDKRLQPDGQLLEGRCSHYMMIAEMVKMDEPEAPEAAEPISVETAACIVHEECAQRSRCNECRLHHICDHRTPEAWILPEEDA